MFRLANAMARLTPKRTTSLLQPGALSVLSQPMSTANPKPTRMSASEAFVETLAERGVKYVWGIVGSAFMDALDLFPAAGITFISNAHEQNSVHCADGYSRITGKASVVAGQNGPGISNMVTGCAAAYWAHSPVIVITPEAATTTVGLGGFQEMDQLPVFSTITKYQTHINNPQRIAELTSRAFDYALNERGPVQINIPRDHFYHVGDYTIPSENLIGRGAGSSTTINKAVELIRGAKNPVIISGGGVVMGDAVEEVKELAELLGAPVACTYLHNDAFPASHPLAVGPLGYMGFRSAMQCLKEADVVIAIGTRLGPFGTLPQYEMEYWPENASIIQVDQNERKLGLVRKVSAGICGDAKETTLAFLQGLKSNSSDSKTKIACLETKSSRAEAIQQYKEDWEKELEEMTYGGLGSQPERGLIKPRIALRELEKAMPANAIVSTDIGNICSVSNSYLRFEQPRSMLGAMTFGNCGYALPAVMGAKVAAPERFCVAYAGDGAGTMALNELLICAQGIEGNKGALAVTMVIFNNRQWGAEKRNQTIWFGDRFVGSNRDENNFAEIAKSMGVHGIRCTKAEEVGPALKEAEAKQKAGETTLIEIMCTRELGPPFRRDAMKIAKRYLPKYAHLTESRENFEGQATDFDK